MCTTTTTHCSHVSDSMSSRSESFFTKQLLSILSQVLNFVELYEYSGRPLLRLEFQSAGSPLWQNIPAIPTAVDENSMRYQPSLPTAMDTSGQSATCNCKFTLNCWHYSLAPWDQTACRPQELFDLVKIIWLPLKKLGNSCTELLNTQMQSKQQVDFDLWLVFKKI